ncbi:hypothetical protein [Kutzneria sp. NPDC052558]|uniref:hypothetical protein n=1 Tax=Kutzneria sp. NPDC052558 TaxID=3364121 RepID=UPI0037C54005
MITLVRRLITDEAGVVTVEMAVYVPIAALIACLLWAYGATASADSAVLHAALDAARAASHARNTAHAQADASLVAQQILHEHNLRCRALTVTVDTAGFAVPVGQPAQVGVEVTCLITLADLYVPGIPGEKTLHAHQISALDTYRTRT